MRVITGKYKGRRFDIPRTFKAHPTTDFAKENIFNVMVGYIDLEGAVCLDLFAGTGSISLEMLSRGAEKVVAIEADREHASFIRRCLDKIGDTNCITICGDAFRYAKTCRCRFDFIFADPPYDLPKIDTLPDLIFAKDLLEEGGIFVLEHGPKTNFSAHKHFVEHRAYGKVNFSLFK